MKKITIKWIDHDAAYKVSEPRWDGGDVYLAADVDARIAELEKALRWAIDEGVHWNKDEKTFMDFNYPAETWVVEPPEGVLETVNVLMDSKPL